MHSALHIRDAMHYTSAFMPLNREEHCGLQANSFAGDDTETLIKTAKSLPIFLASSRGSQPVRFKKFAEGMHLVPCNAPRDVLASTTVLCWDTRQRSVMIEQLRIPVWSLTDFYRSESGESHAFLSVQICNLSST